MSSPSHASALFDATFRLRSWSESFAPVIGVAPAVLRAGIAFADLMIQRPPAISGGRSATLQQVSGKLTLDVVRGRAPGHIRLLLPDDRLLDVDIEPHPGGTIIVACRIVPPDGVVRTDSANPRRRGPLQALIDAVPVALVYVDRERVVRACNEEFANWTRESRQSIVGRKMAALLPAELNAELARFMSELPDDGPPVAFETTLKDRRDRERFVRVQLARLDPIPGTTEGTLVSVLDLTEERALQLLSKRNMDMLRRLLQSSPAAVAIMRNSDGTVLFANERLAQLLGRRVPPMGENGNAMLLRGLLPVLVGDISANGRLRDYPTQVKSEADGTQRDLLTTMDVIDYEDERALVWWAYDVTSLQARQDKLARQAYADALTGLPNRLAFDIELRDAMKAAQRGRCGALLLLDLDGFKKVNDTFGHDAGDHLLDRVGARLADCIGSRDFVARLGGDEFAIILKDFDPMVIDRLGNQVISIISQPVHWTGGELVVGVSIGVAAIEGPIADPAEIYKQADMALYEAKRAGKGTTRVFNPLSRTTDLAIEPEA